MEKEPIRPDKDGVLPITVGKFDFGITIEPSDRRINQVVTLDPGVMKIAARQAEVQRRLNAGIKINPKYYKGRRFQ